MSNLLYLSSSMHLKFPILKEKCGTNHISITYNWYGAAKVSHIKDQCTTNQLSSNYGKGILTNHVSSWARTAT